MVKLFITDLDGCITDPFITPDWKAFSKVRQMNLNSHFDDNIPPLTICTGRPMPYAEAMAQILGIRLPFLFESGGGMYDVEKNELTWNPALTKEREQEVIEIKAWAKDQLIDKNPSSIPEFTKFTDIGIINPNSEVIYESRDIAVEYIEANFPHFEVHFTEVSVNIILKKANKGEGIKMIAGHLGYELSEIAYIGDSSGDIPGLKIVKLPFAPSNAAIPVKDVARVMNGKSTDGVLEAYHSIIEYNLNY
ncbi:MAG: HAD-IIB family hydrolase [Balneolaceae bacterium]